MKGDTRYVLRIKRENTSKREVKFEGLIQQICKDFGINYIWYDQMCINQDNHEEKMREIKRMHLIYKNARCTLALVPEIHAIPPHHDCYDSFIVYTSMSHHTEWCKRIWTLEEAYMSKDILFLGTDAHIWSRQKPESEHFFRNIPAKQKWSACTTLWYARSRTSSKAHDRIFALVNIFPELKNDINFTYKQPLIDLMLQFYGRLAEKDISILLFGSPYFIYGGEDEIDKEIMMIRKVEAEILPSWTGANGIHILQDSHFEKPDQSFCCTINADRMSLRSESIHIHIETAASVKRLHSIYNGTYHLIDGLPHEARYSPGTIFDSDASAGLTFVGTTWKTMNAYNIYTSGRGVTATHFLPMKYKQDEVVVTNTLSEPALIGGVLSLTEECSECVIVSGLKFRGVSCIVHPVIKKCLDSYESIGLCILFYDFNFDSITRSIQTFHIK